MEAATEPARERGQAAERKDVQRGGDPRRDGAAGEDSGGRRRDPEFSRGTARPGDGHDEGSRLSALGSRLSALGSRLSALGSRLSALGSRLSALGSRLSALGSRLSALGSRLSALGSRLSALGSYLQCDPQPPPRSPEPPADRGFAPETGSAAAAVGAGPAPAANPPVAGSCRRWDPGGACNCSMGGSHFHLSSTHPRGQSQGSAAHLPAPAGWRFAKPPPVPRRRHRRFHTNRLQ